MGKLLKLISISAFIFFNFFVYSVTPVRIKDIAVIQGLKENQLTGIGLVTGLKGQGDSPKFELTRKMLYNFTSNFGFNIKETDVNSKNVAAVVVTARTDGFTRVGDSINVSISTIGDAKSLEGGILLQTALQGANGVIYAVAQGRLLTGTKAQGTESTGSIPGGAIVEQNIISNFIQNNTIRLIIKNADFTTANMIKEAIIGLNPEFKVNASDSGIVEIILDEVSAKDPVNIISQIEVLTVTPDFTNAVVIDKKTGVIVTGGGVIIQECTVSTASLSLSVNKKKNANEPKKNSMKITATTVDELVNVLNQTGIPVNEITALLEAIHRTGALNAKLIIL
ncbi:MAG: hypothetical protein A2015_06325 [Spirochaetes bacterium GWF1_31_7]|nr:MAG: hypothetical protein A2Y30_08160 [Spirochaetes bacterium GWE1_32_154]OHD51363.1 MAG: hypothetical protein A2Y29_14545 [Spirochaetes bacterium GWE2_31_10]OHD53089.1 MAG: hypothetical protein A2015_06325 [Spirochaetes bacterium GWF1_31_7]OHD79283.1 MAG: hypothetical protein A2355_06035 [Spirochaetes bacterium RIFOXYB1_FULL_32_8]HBD95132.1 hypothetical protein [Spirochaetia bacterium]